MTIIRAATIQCVADEHGAQTHTVTRGQTTYTVLAHDRHGAEQAVDDYIRNHAAMRETEPELFSE